MILKVFLLVVISLSISLFLFFVLNILMPTVKNLTLQNVDPIFSPLEVNYIHRKVASNIKTSQKRAVVLSPPASESEEKNRLEYNGIKNCSLFFHSYGTKTFSNWDCVGFGDCAAACPQEAIDITEGVAVVTQNCSGCGLCVSACPKDLIALFPREQKTVLFKGEEGNPHAIEPPEKRGFQFWKSVREMLG